MCALIGRRFWGCVPNLEGFSAAGCKNFDGRSHAIKGTFEARCFTKQYFIHGKGSCLRENFLKTDTTTFLKIIHYCHSQNTLSLLLFLLEHLED
jgi:hypothetical protein